MRGVWCVTSQTGLPFLEQFKHVEAAVQEAGKVSQKTVKLVAYPQNAEASLQSQVICCIANFVNILSTGNVKIPAKPRKTPCCTLSSMVKLA